MFTTLPPDLGLLLLRKAFVKPQFYLFLQRSSRYDDLMIAEEKAKKSSNGLHNKKPSTARRIADISGEKSKQFLPFLQRAGRMQAVVEFVASASR